MAILRASEVREKDDAEMESHLDELRKKLMKIRGVLASGGIPEDVGKTREIRKTIARILTIRHERKLGLKREVKKAAALKEKEEKLEKPAEAGEKPKQDKPKIQRTKTKKEEVSKKK